MIDRRTLLRGFLGAASPLSAWACISEPAARVCARGALEARYCDEDGDLLADLATDPAEVRDPATLVFAYTPVEDPAQYRQVWDGFLRHLAETTERRVRFYPVQSNAAQIEAMRAGRLHVAGFNTGSTPLAVNCGGFRPLRVMADADGRFGYEMEIIVRADSPWQAVSELRGRTFAFVSPSSNSGYKAPMALLRSRHGMDTERDLVARFSGRHDNSVLGVVYGDWDAAAVANVVLRRMIDRGLVDGSSLRTIDRSPTFPTTAYGVSHRLPTRLVQAVDRAFATFPWAGSALAHEFREMAGFVPIDYARDWAVVREVDRAMGVEWTCR